MLVKYFYECFSATFLAVSILVLLTQIYKYKENCKLKKIWAELIDNALVNQSFYHRNFLFMPVQLKIQNAYQIADLVQIFYKKVKYEASN